MCGFYSLFGETDLLTTILLNAKIKKDDDTLALQIQKV